MRTTISYTLAGILLLVSSAKPVFADADDLCPGRFDYMTRGAAVQGFEKQPIIFGAICAALGAGLASLFGDEESSSQAVRQMRINHIGLRKAIKQTHDSIRKDMKSTQRAIQNVYKNNACKVKLLTNHPVTGLRAAEYKKQEVEGRTCDGTPQTNCTQAEKEFWVARAQANIDRILANIEKYKTDARVRAEKMEAARQQRQARAMARLQRMASRAGPEGAAAMGGFLGWLANLLATMLPLIGLLACQIGTFALF